LISKTPYLKRFRSKIILAIQLGKCDNFGVNKTTTNHIPKVGVGVMVFKNSRVLIGKRKDSHGQGEYATGGHLEFGETIEDCAKREVFEETGMKITNIRFQYFANLTTYLEKHYAHVQLIADWKSGEPQVLEPQKCEGWSWYRLTDLPRPTFKTLQMFLESYKTGKIFFDS
jgi:8-oxo-dGTP diphosphatase